MTQREALRVIREALANATIEPEPLELEQAFTAKQLRRPEIQPLLREVARLLTEK